MYKDCLSILFYWLINISVIGAIGFISALLLSNKLIKVFCNKK